MLIRRSCLIIILLVCSPKDNGMTDTSRLPNKIGARMPPVFFTPLDVSNCIKQLKHNGSAGPDNIPAEFFESNI